MEGDNEKNSVTQRRLNPQTGRSSKVMPTQRDKSFSEPNPQAINRPSPNDLRAQAGSSAAGDTNPLAIFRSSGAAFAQRVNNQFHQGSKSSRAAFARQMSADRHIAWRDLPSSAASRERDVGRQPGADIGSGVAGVRSALSDLQSSKSRSPGGEQVAQPQASDSKPEINARQGSDLAFQSVLDTFSDLSGNSATGNEDERRDREERLASYYDSQNGQGFKDAKTRLNQFRDNFGAAPQTTPSGTGGNQQNIRPQINALVNQATAMIDNVPKDRRIAWGDLSGIKTGVSAVRAAVKTFTGKSPAPSPNRGQIDNAIQQSKQSAAKTPNKDMENPG